MNRKSSQTTSMASSVHITTLPAVKMIMHAAKHPESAVNGLLLCNQSDVIKLTITDYVPLFHCALTLTPMLEAALYQVEAYCDSENLRICGYFQANEHISDKEPTTFAYKIAEKLNEKSGPACLIMLRNDRLYPPSSEHFIVHTNAQGKWQELKHTVSSEVPHSLTQAFRSKLFQAMYDFDDHLDDINCDYLNAELSKCIFVDHCD
ncbi:unnamed protein product [Dicrocoelium dendriticum]|nr:unnamed protein product [Dicrocoelium dendriticum]